MPHIAFLEKTGTLKINYVETDASQWQRANCGALCCTKACNVSFIFFHMAFKAFMKNEEKEKGKKWSKKIEKPRKNTTTTKKTTTVEPETMQLTQNIDLRHIINYKFIYNFLIK